jgi:hypothetical protein
LPIDTLKPGTKPPDEINVVVEIPRGSKIKYEIDPKNGGISVDRTLFPAFFYPILETMLRSYVVNCLGNSLRFKNSSARGCRIGRRLLSLVSPCHRMKAYSIYSNYTKWTVSDYYFR